MKLFYSFFKTDRNLSFSVDVYVNDVCVRRIKTKIHFTDICMQNEPNLISHA